MPRTTGGILQSLATVPNLQVSTGVPLALHTRFGIGGPAAIFVETADVAGFVAALRVARAAGCRVAAIGGGSNLIVADEGFDGVVLRYTAADSMVQAVCLGTEFSIDVFCDLGGRCLASVPRTMIESKGGGRPKSIILEPGLVARASTQRTPAG